MFFGLLVCPGLKVVWQFNYLVVPVLVVITMHDDRGLYGRLCIPPFLYTMCKGNARVHFYHMPWALRFDISCVIVQGDISRYMVNQDCL